MARPIDAYQAIDIIDEWLDSVGTVMIGKGLSSYGELIGCIEETPTLTPPNEWVSVEDRLPASGQNVIATNGSDVGEAWYASLSRSWYRYNGLEWNRICREVTHWMPLPEPPDSRPPEGEEGDANRA